LILLVGWEQKPFILFGVFGVDNFGITRKKRHFRNGQNVWENEEQPKEEEKEQEKCQTLEVGVIAILEFCFGGWARMLYRTA
jgi:hypothetical protein